MSGYEIFDRVPYKTRKEWLELRGKGIGGSDAASILGHNNWKTNYDLYLEKIGSKKMDNISNKYTIYGNAAEQHIRGIFKADYPGLKVTHSKSLLIRKDKPHIRGTLDGELKVKENLDFYSYFKPEYNNSKQYSKMELKKGMRGVLEIKTTEILNSMHKEKWTNQIPMNYYCQILHYLLVTGYDFAIIIVQLTSDYFGSKLHTTRQYGIFRDDKIEDLKYLEIEEDIFWNNHVLPKIEVPQIILI